MVSSSGDGGEDVRSGHVRVGASGVRRAGGGDHPTRGSHGHHPGLRGNLYPFPPLKTHLFWAVYAVSVYINSNFIIIFIIFNSLFFVFISILLVFYLPIYVILNMFLH